MAIAKECPIADPHRGRAQFAEHLPRVLGKRTLEECGWVIASPLSLLVPVKAGVDGADDYLVRLGFEYYAEWPPTVQFINPRTLTFDSARDLYWLPRIEGDEGFSVHIQYQHSNYTGQLVCCSFSAEFYMILHHVRQELVWNAERHTFLATLSRVNQALRSPYYKGRFDPTKPRE
jgi:hypothetical protein